MRDVKGGRLTAKDVAGRVGGTARAGGSVGTTLRVGDAVHVRRIGEVVRSGGGRALGVGPNADAGRSSRGPVGGRVGERSDTAGVTICTSLAVRLSCNGCALGGNGLPVLVGEVDVDADKDTGTTGRICLFRGVGINGVRGVVGRVIIEDESMSDTNPAGRSAGLWLATPPSSTSMLATTSRCCVARSLPLHAQRHVMVIERGVRGAWDSRSARGQVRRRP